MLLLGIPKEERAQFIIDMDIEGMTNQELRKAVKKIEKTASKLLNAIKGNSDLCKSSEAKKIPAEYLEWVISNYYYKLIPRKSLETALDFVDLKADDFADPSEELIVRHLVTPKENRIVDLFV